jgi:GTP-binding protein Era
MDTPFRSGFVTLIGRPNVGKSTLLNALLGQKVAAVSPRPQTTRRRQLGILTLKTAQLVFMDTPGIHKPQHQLGQYMNEVALQTIPDADVVIWLVDASVSPHPEDKLIAKQITEHPVPGWLLMVLNKCDLISPDEIKHRIEQYSELFPNVETFPISSLDEKNRQVLLEIVIEHLPEGPAFYDEDQVTDLYERDIAADLIREAALYHLRDEIPHSIGVKIDEYTERSDQLAYVLATLYLERENHKGIVIGKGGEMLKKIGSTARKEIEAMSGRKVFLELKVKVNKNWRDNPEVLSQLGYVLPKDD